MLPNFFGGILLEYIDVNITKIRHNFLFYFLHFTHISILPASAVDIHYAYEVKRYLLLPFERSSSLLSVDYHS